MIALDLSRLLSRAGRGTPTGIDRVELAYAEHLIALAAPCCFVATRPGRRLGLLPRRAAERIRPRDRRRPGAAALDPRDAGAAGAPDCAPRPARAAGRQRAALTAGCATAAADPVYLLVSHHHLEKRRLIARLKQRSAARFVCLIHDLIPIEFPEYAKPGQAENHLRRIETAAAYRRRADRQLRGDRRDALQPHLDRAGRGPRRCWWRRSAPICRPPPETASPPIDRPYFVYVSTIEARKNHLLLLNLWRRLGRRTGRRAPRTGAGRAARLGNRKRRRHARPLPGAARLGRSSTTPCPTRRWCRCCKGARALLLPSFAEGFGFPLIEALQLGVPALCSDIPALRETGGAVPEFLDPLDGPGWRRAILDYAAPESPRRAAQLARLAGWRPPRWDASFRDRRSLYRG